MSGAQLFNNTTKERMASRRKKKHREISMSDVMPKFENTLQMKMEASAANFHRLMLQALANATDQSNNGFERTIKPSKLTFVEFIKIYPCFEEWEFLSFFTVKDIVTMRLLCKDTSLVFTDEVMYNLIRIGNLDPSLRLNFWVIQAPFFE